jgi:hypothetical protein
MIVLEWRLHRSCRKAPWLATEQSAWQDCLNQRSREASMAKGLLFASFDYSPAQEDEFNDWYDLEHVPERMRVPGFLNAQRWIGDDNPKIAVATYDLESHAVLNSAPYLAVGYGNASVWTKRVTAIANRILRFEGNQIVPGDLAGPAEANGLLVASMNIDPAAEPEFNEWYNSEHLPQLAAVPGVLTARRFQAAGKDVERKYLALYHLTSPDVAKSDAWSKAANTPWTAKIRPHFNGLVVMRCKKYVRKG